MVLNLPSVLVLSGLLAMNTINSGLIAQGSETKTVQVLSAHTMPLDDRYPNASVNEVFKNNILLNLGYLKGGVDSKNINWNQVTSPNHFQITLHPGETFIYHSGSLPEYDLQNSLIGDSTFSFQDGYKSDGYLYGDGVCHLASLFNWAASDAGLSVNAPTNHDFAVIPDIPKKYGTAIYYSPAQTETNAKENLYITNNKTEDVIFNVDYSNSQVNVSVTE